MRNFLLLISILTLHFGGHSQMVIGGKASYERYFSPQLNGGTLHVFAEKPLGPYDCFALRAGIFCRLPMSYTDNVSPVISFFQDPWDTENDLFGMNTRMRSTCTDIGLFSEFMYFFRNQSIDNGFYVMVRTGISYSTIKRRADSPGVQQYLSENDLTKNSQFSLSLGPGAGYQFYLGKNSMLFSEIQFAFPFISIEGDFFGFSSTTVQAFPQFSLSGNVGFKYFLFN